MRVWDGGKAECKNAFQNHDILAQQLLFHSSGGPRCPNVASATPALLDFRLLPSDRSAAERNERFDGCSKIWLRRESRDVSPDGFTDVERFV